MSHKRHKPTYAAPRGSAGTAYRLPAYGSPVSEPVQPVRDPGSSAQPSMRMPGVDDRLAIPEAGEEYIDGVRFEALAGEAEHADPQCQLAYVVRGCVAEGYVASTELLTRSDSGSDFATDVCVRREGQDPRTGQRYLEELSFEVANTQTLADLKHRAKKLMARGVRRLFAVMVEEGQVREWTRAGWRVRAPRGEIRDRTFEKPLRIRAILYAAEADRLVAEALWEKREPFLVQLVDKERAEGHAEGLAEGRTKGLAEAILRAFKRHGLPVTPQQRQVLLACHDPSLLVRWLDEVLVFDTAAKVLSELKDKS
ncbi:MAG: hypothetical protein GY722_27855 [bacterium]|nr:hypothetical protein [bacterium]